MKILFCFLRDVSCGVTKVTAQAVLSSVETGNSGNKRHPGAAVANRWVILLFQRHHKLTSLQMTCERGVTAFLVAFLSFPLSEGVTKTSRKKKKKKVREARG